MYYNERGNLFIEVDDICHGCMWGPRQDPKCPLIKALVEGAVYLESDDSILQRCELYKPTLTLVEEVEEEEPTMGELVQWPGRKKT